MCCFRHIAPVAALLKANNVPPFHPPMLVACLPHGSDESQLRRVLSGVPSVEVLVLPDAGGGWASEMLSALRRELFLQPELQVLLAVEQEALDRTVAAAAEVLCQANSGGMAIARTGTRGGVGQLVEWLAAGETLAHAATGQALTEEAMLHSVSIRFGAAPIVEACEIGASLVIAESPAPGALTLGAIYALLGIESNDWTRLATAEALARLVESPREARPLWLEVGDAGHLELMGLPTLTQEVLQAPFIAMQADLADRPSPDVAIDMAQAEIVPSGPGRFSLKGIVGSPPEARLAAEIEYYVEPDTPHERWPIRVSRRLAEWDVQVRPATEWSRRLN